MKRARTTTKSSAKSHIEAAKLVTAKLVEFGFEDVSDMKKICQLILASIQKLEEKEEEPEETSSRRRRRKQSKSKEDSNAFGRLALWEGTGNVAFSGNIQFAWDGQTIKDEHDADVVCSVLLFEPDEDSKYIYSGMLTEKTDPPGRGKKRKRSPIVGRIYVYESGRRDRRNGIDAYAYIYPIAEDDTGKNVDPDFLYELTPEEFFPEEGALCKVLIKENDNGTDDSPLYIGTAYPPGELPSADEEEEEEEEETTTRSSRRKRGEANTTTKRSRRSSNKNKSPLDFSSVDIPDVYEDEDDDDEF